MNITSRLEPMQRWLDSLQARERNIVIAGAILLVIMLFYLLIWEPVFSSLEEQQQHYTSQKQLLNWMQLTASEIRLYELAGASSSSRFNNQSVSSLVERSATTSGVKAFIRKLESAENTVKVQLEQADFDKIIIWLNDLQQKYGIYPQKIHIEPQKVAGAVNARINLERADS